MIEDAKEDGIKLWVVSGFRTWAQQNSLFNNCTNFSVHGSNLSSATWAGEQILDNTGRVKHPTELSMEADTYCQSGPGCTNIIFDENVTSLGSSSETGAFRRWLYTKRKYNSW